MSTGWLAAIVFSALALEAVLIAVWALFRRWRDRMTQLAGSGERQAWAGWRRFRVARTVMEDAAETIRSFYLEPVDGRPLPPFRAGQYVTVRFDGPASPAQSLTRCYSLSDAPSSDHYRISVKRVAPVSGQAAGKMSNVLHDRIVAGCEILLRAPSGQFVLDPDDVRPPVLIAAGVGIAPIWSMLQVLLDKDPDREAWLIFGVRNGREQPFRAALASLCEAHPGLHAVVCYSRPEAQDRRDVDFQATGHVDVSLLARVLPEKSLPYYICGPGALMESLVPSLRAWGVSTSLIHYESFGPSSLDARTDVTATAAGDASSCLVTFSRSARTVAWSANDQSLLDLAERSGIDVAAGCRAGKCGSCETPVLSGSVAYRQAPGSEIAAGSCLLCIARPSSDLVLGA